MPLFSKLTADATAFNSEQTPKPLILFFGCFSHFKHCLSSIFGLIFETGFIEFSLRQRHAF